MKVVYGLCICGSLITFFSLYCAPHIAEAPLQNLNLPQKQASLRQNIPKRTISITSHVTKKSTGYLKLFKTWYPDAFTLKINGVTVFDLKNPQEQNTSFAIPVSGNTLTVSYTYEFRNGKRTGEKSIIFRVPVNLKTSSISFSWKDEPRIEIHGASLIEPIQRV